MHKQRRPRSGRRCFAIAVFAHLGLVPHVQSTGVIIGVFFKTPMIWLVRLIAYLSAFLLSVILAYLGKFAYYMLLSRRLIKKTKIFERQSGTVHMVVVGDSTAVGVGSEKPADSLPSLLADKYHDARVTNRAQSGIYTRELPLQFNRNETCDLLFCAVGGLDILFFQPVEQVCHELEQFLQYATKQANHVIFVTPLNLGLSPVFPSIVRSFYRKRSVKFGEAIQKVVNQFENATVLNNLLIESKNEIPAWETISAPDQIHPNSAGYRWAFEQLEKRGLPSLP